MMLGGALDHCHGPNATLFRGSVRERVRLFNVELPGHFIDAAIARGLLDTKQCDDAWAVIQACYAAQVSDATLDWLVRNEVVTLSQRGDAATILRGINSGLERT
jgi:hypothetical protein